MAMDMSYEVDDDDYSAAPWKNDMYSDADDEGSPEFVDGQDDADDDLSNLADYELKDDYDTYFDNGEMQDADGNGIPDYLEEEDSSPSYLEDERDSQENMEDHYNGM